MDKYEVENLWNLKHPLIVVVSTHEGGTPPGPAKWFVDWLEESAHDFRVGNSALSGLSYAVYGCGNSLYGDNFNKVGSF